MPPPIALHTPLPEGIAIIRPAAPKGVGLITTRAFDAGAVLFQGEATLITTTAPTDPNSDLPYANLTVHDPAQDSCVVGNYPIRLHQHTTRLPGSPSRRLLHAGLGSLINHGCDPSTVVEAMGVMGEEDRGGAAAGGSVLHYEVRAARPLAAGDELTCDYTLAEYDATEKGVDPCHCGAPEGVCLGGMRGFKHLPFPHQLRRLGRVADPVFGQFCLDHAPTFEVIDRRDGPEGDGAVFLDCGIEGQPPRLLVTRAVGLGEVVYEGRSRVVRPLGNGGGYPQVILVVGPHALPLDPLPLFSSTFDDAGGRETYGCDSLMRHACGDRATTTWEWTTTVNNDNTRDGSSHDSATATAPFCRYRVLSARDLQAGEELTVDYRTLSYRGVDAGLRAGPPHRRQAGGEYGDGDGSGDGSSLSSRPLPAVGALGLRCECCGREVFR